MLKMGWYRVAEGRSRSWIMVPLDRSHTLFLLKHYSSRVLILYHFCDIVTDYSLKLPFFSTQPISDAPIWGVRIGVSRRSLVTGNYRYPMQQYSIDCMVITSVMVAWYQHVTDGQTDKLQKCYRSIKSWVQGEVVLVADAWNNVYCM